MLNLPQHTATNGLHRRYEGNAPFPFCGFRNDNFVGTYTLVSILFSQVKIPQNDENAHFVVLKTCFPRACLGIQEG